ncbi:hypothetical protein MSBRW_2511 [Methanosarcina barkeri str. Wiesmoor]|uniref:Uncharacterized protein n=2 Tax=Methanosarcina barkeri TaxID=2208 RepID=A0A0E3QLC6_METBA|nr:hypothetical protein [Methanosarcina barkeri]AKB51764.1 hypothetical protein MSBRW_2511 [Methanosarcina barkeri str. Wiesmoor]
MFQRQAYFVHIDLPQYGFAVIAISREDAKKFAFTRILSLKQNGYFVDPHVYRHGLQLSDLHANIIADADISNLPEGVVLRDKDSLLRGIYDHTGLLECDICGETDRLYRDPIPFKGRSINAVCAKCFNKRKRIQKLVQVATGRGAV